MCPRGPGILLPGNYCCYYSHRQRGEECLVFKDTPNCPRERGSWNSRLAGKVRVGGTAGETYPFAWDIAGGRGGF